MKTSLTTGEFTRMAGHSYRGIRKNSLLISTEEPPTRQAEGILTGMERFCRKYSKSGYCERCQNEDCVRSLQ